MSLTDDPNDPRLTHGPDDQPVPQAEVYLVLSEEERAKGFVRPMRRTYIHIGPPGPTPERLRDLDAEEQERFAPYNYVKFEPYPESESPVTGRFWTQAQLDAAQRGGCKFHTTMNEVLCETYARDPHFYGSTYCAHCQMHRPVEEFVWAEDGERVGS